MRVYAQKISVLGTGNEDALYAVVNFENGAIGQIDYSWAWPDGLMNGYRAALEVVGEGPSVVIRTAMVDDHVRARPGESLAESLPDPLRPAGHQRGSAVQDAFAHGMPRGWGGP